MHMVYKRNNIDVILIQRSQPKVDYIDKFILIIRSSPYYAESSLGMKRMFRNEQHF